MAFDYFNEANRIADQYKIRVTYRSCRGYANTKTRSITCTAPKGYKSFFTFLHEVGHIEHPQGDYGKARTRALAEYNATQWAIEKLKELGLPLKRDVKRSYDVYIKNKIARGLRRGGTVPKELAHIGKGVTRNTYLYK